jgi:hypothetical protein
MKRYIYRFMFILSTLVPAASCAEKMSDAEDLAGRERTTIEVSYAVAGTEVNSVTVASASVKKTLEVTVNNDNLKWNIESNRDWCVVVPEEHCGSGTVTLSIAANEDFEAREPATLTFVAETTVDSRLPLIRMLLHSLSDSRISCPVKQVVPIM